MTNIAKASPNDSITYGCAGGYTGGGSGVTVKRDGTITQWTSSLAAPNKKVLGHRDVDFANEVFDKIAASNFLATDYNQPGNMTCSLTMTDATSSHTVSWSGEQVEKIQLLVDFSTWFDAAAKQRMQTKQN